MTQTVCNCDEALRGYVAYFETLQPASLQDMARYFAPDARFKDPFNDVTGPDAIAAIFADMFKRSESPRFTIHDWLCAGSQASIRWRFTCCVQGLALDFHGMSHVRFDNQGKVIEHIDYWDPAEAIYEKIPLLGGLMRMLRRRISS